jgi:misacylated tRNA(Ala) deacylase
VTEKLFRADTYRRAGVATVVVVGEDVQPCGGTHVTRTGEIGRVRIGKVEKKGRQNRRLSDHLD